MNSGSIKNMVNLHGSIVSLGARGYSNYEIAVQNGFEGSEQEWLDSLVGPVGPRGPIGPNNFHVGEEEPEDENVSVWLDTDEPIPNTYVPVATEETLGTIKPGNNLKVDKNGKLEMTIYASNVEEMVNSKLKTNDVVRTLGYYEPNDGGGALYLIREKKEDDIEDKGSIHFVGDTLVAELIIKDSVNIKQFGAKGDGVSNDYIPINNVFKFICKNHNDNKSKYNIEFPKANYLIKTSDLFNGCKEIDSYRIHSIILKGNKSTLLFEGFSGNCFLNDNKFMFLTFNNFDFKSIEDELDRNLFDSYSEGGAQRFIFNDCTWSGYFNQVIKLRGELCNSEWYFNECHMGQFSKWNSFLYCDNETGSDDFVNYHFNDCTYWVSSNMIHFDKGGHVHIDNCDFSLIKPDEATYLFELGNESEYGANSYGCQAFTVSNSRFELANVNAKVINAYWQQGQILFKGCDFTPNVHLHEYGEDVYYFKAFTGNPIVKFEDCKLFGQITTKAFNNGINGKVEVENCLLYGANIDINDYVKTIRNGNNYAYYDVKFTNCRMYGQDNIINFTTNSMIAKNATLNNIVSSSISWTAGEVPQINDDSWIQKIYKPTLIKSVNIIPYIHSDGWQREAIIKSHVSNVYSIDGVKVTVELKDINRFRKNMILMINDIKYKITYVNYSGHYFNVELVNSSDTNTIAVNDDIYIIVADYTFKSDGSMSEIYTMNTPVIVYNDLTLSIITGDSRKVMYGNIFVESIQ